MNYIFKYNLPILFLVCPLPPSQQESISFHGLHLQCGAWYTMRTQAIFLEQDGTLTEGLMLEQECSLLFSSVNGEYWG